MEHTGNRIPEGVVGHVAASTDTTVGSQKPFRNDKKLSGSYTVVHFQIVPLDQEPFRRENARGQTR